MDLLDKIGLKKLEAQIAKDKTMLDIGCGDGSLLFDFRLRGWLTKGVEISKPALQYMHLWDLYADLGTVENQHYDNESFLMVSMSHVIEHLSDPKHTLTEIARILKPQGYLLVRTPCWDSLTSLISGKYWLSDPDHLLFFSRQTLNKLLNQIGFQEIGFCSYVGVDCETYPAIWDDLGFNDLLRVKLAVLNQGDVMILLAQKRK
ncbi:MAG: class I SAM-dependent methyltransferase [bacterium]|nr:class I SAM-dependent methyltransferase [bacterium]